MSEGSGSSTWKYVGIGCAVIALLGLCGVGACVACTMTGVGGVIAATEAPAESVRTFFGAIRRGDLAGAYGQTATGYRSTFSLEQFTAAVAAQPQLAASTDQTISQRNIDAATGATMGGTLDTPTGATPFTTHLVQEDGAWRVDSFSVGSF